MIALAIDASTYRGTVAVVEGRSILAAGEAQMRGVLAEALMPTVARTLASAGLEFSAIRRVICGAGPGSFTSLRIGAGIAKGVAFGSGVPVYAVSSLALTLAVSTAPPGNYIVTADALRDEWYAALLVRHDDGSVATIRPAVIVPKSELASLAQSASAVILGAASGSGGPHAAGCIDLADEIEGSGPVDLDRWEPAYGRLAEAQVTWEAVHGRALS